MAQLRLCITATDTDAGKTLVTAALGRAARSGGRRVLAVKPVQTGCVRDARGNWLAPDVAVYREAAAGVETGVLECFGPACSPHLAAREAGRLITASALARGVDGLLRESPADLALLEGAGGLLTPINERETFADLFALLGWPLLLVVPNRLGAVNHALLSLESARYRKLAVLGFILSETAPAQDGREREIRRDNAAIIQQLSGCPCLAELAWLPGLRKRDTAAGEKSWQELAVALAPALRAVEKASAPLSEDIPATAHPQ